MWVVKLHFWLSNVWVIIGIVETRSPTSTYVIVAGWSNPTYAYASDDNRAFSFTDNAQQGYGGYGFNIPSGSTIHKVEIGVEGYVGFTGEAVEVYYSVNAGSTWTLAGTLTDMSEFLKWFDRTGDRAWTPSDLSDANFRVKIRSIVFPACFAADTEVALWPEDGDLTRPPRLRKIQDVKVGDILIGWDVEKSDFCPNRVLDLKEHRGDFEVLWIICGIPEQFEKHALKRAEGLIHTPEIEAIIDELRATHPYRYFKDIAVTPNHPVTTFNRGEILAGEVKPYHDYLWGCFGPELKIQPVPVVEIRRFKTNVVYDLRCEKKHFFKHFSMIVEIK